MVDFILHIKFQRGGGWGWIVILAKYRLFLFFIPVKDVGIIIHPTVPTHPKKKTLRYEKLGSSIRHDFGVNFACLYVCAQELV